MRIHAVDFIASKKNCTLTITTKPCGFCCKPGTVTVPKDGFYRWFNFEVPIQDALRDVPKEQREQLISGICPDCWEKYFGLGCAECDPDGTKETA